MAAKKTKEDLGFEQSLERLEIIVENYGKLVV